MKGNFLLLFILLLAVSSVQARRSDFRGKEGESLEEVLAKVNKPPLLTPEGKRQWRLQRKTVMDEQVAATNRRCLKMHCRSVSSHI